MDTEDDTAVCAVVINRGADVLKNISVLFTVKNLMLPPGIDSDVVSWTVTTRYQEWSLGSCITVLLARRNGDMSQSFTSFPAQHVPIHLLSGWGLVS